MKNAVVAFLVCTSALVHVCANYSNQDGFVVGQATLYTSIYQGSCGFFSNINKHGYIGAWPDCQEGYKAGVGTFGQNGYLGFCGKCVEVACVPAFVKDKDGTINLDRRDVCKDANRGLVIQLTDTCPCSGNGKWCCCHQPHIDLSEQAFRELVNGDPWTAGIIGLKWRPADCSRIGITRLDTSPSSQSWQPAASPTPPPPPSYQPPSPAPSPSTKNPKPTPSPPTKDDKPPASPTPKKSKDSSSPTNRPPPAAMKGKTTHGSTQTKGTSSSPTCRPDIPTWGRCGGRPGWQQGQDAAYTDKCCKKGDVCKRFNEYYWQCVPSSGR